MNIRPLDRSANRSGVIARRASVVALAAAVVIAPVFAAAPAFAVIEEPVFPVSSIALSASVLNAGESATVSYNGDPALTTLATPATCYAEYKNGVLTHSTLSPVSSYTVQYSTLVASYGGSFAQGDKYTLAYYAQDSSRGDGLDSCFPPALSTITAQASLTLGAPAPVPAPAQELAVSAAPITVKQGVAVDQIVAITFGAGWDFSAKGGWIEAGPQSSAGLENGEIYPLAGLEYETIGANTPGVTPTLRVFGTPKYSGVVESGFQAGDNTSYGFGAIVFTIAPANGINSPIQIEAAAGQPVAGAKVNVIVSGLKEGAAWDVTVRSTPIIVGSGTIAFGGQLAQTVTIPAGLAAGSHSITVTSTNADGSVFSSVLYFTVSASGTLVSVSATGPQLAATGTDPMAASLIAGGLLVAGLALAGVSVYRRRSSN